MYNNTLGAIVTDRKWDFQETKRGEGSQKATITGQVNQDRGENFDWEVEEERGKVVVDRSGNHARTTNRLTKPAV